MQRINTRIAVTGAGAASMVAALMAADFAAFQARADGTGIYEKREDPSIASVAQAIDKIATAFEEYKQTNDDRLEALKKGLPTGDFEAKLKRIDGDMDSLQEQKSRLEKIEAKLARPGALTGADREQPTSQEAEAYKSAFVSWVRNPGDQELKNNLQMRGKELRKYEAKQRISRGNTDDDDVEFRATQVNTSTGSAGGFALPEVIESQIARLALDTSPIRQISTVRQVSSPDYKELFDINGTAFEWVGEGDTRNQTNTSDLAEVAPTFGMGSAKPQATEESLDDLFFNVEQWLVESAGDAIGQGEGAAFIAGNGTKKPTGFLAGPTPVTAIDGARAFGVLQYIASGQAAALPSSLDTFYDVVYSLRARYRRNSRWVMNKLSLAGVRKYKDSTGQYMWQPSLVVGQPDQFLGYAITEAEDMPLIGAGAFPIAFGDFKEGYLIADRVGMRITRDEITQPGFVKFYVRRRVGGKIRNSQAIKLLKIAAS